MLTLSLLASSLFIELPPGEYHYEKDFQAAGCKGQIEYKLPDRTRVDCLTDTHAIEYDFANKWPEAVGQSLWYAFQTNKKAGIVLIYKKPEDVRFYHKLMSVIAQNALKIDVWVIDPS